MARNQGDRKGRPYYTRDAVAYMVGATLAVALVPALDRLLSAAVKLFG